LSSDLPHSSSLADDERFRAFDLDGVGDRQYFTSVKAAGRVEDPYSRPHEHFTIWLFRGPKQDLRAVWPAMKKFD
jgi:hypothetical protein